MKTWKTLVSLLAIAQLSCAAEPGNVFEVVRLLDASATCQYDLGDNTFPSRVTFDAASVGASFVGFGLRNHMSTADTQTVETAEGISLRSQVNTLTLKGFEICITLAVPNEIDPVDCASIDGSAALQAKQFYRTTSVIPPAPDLSGGEINAAAMIKLFDSDTLASLFGNEGGHAQGGIPPPPARSDGASRSPPSTSSKCNISPDLKKSEDGKRQQHGFLGGSIGGGVKTSFR